jgi:hypothetical protein
VNTLIEKQNRGIRAVNELQGAAFSARVMNQTSANTSNFVGANGRTDSTAANRNSTVAYSCHYASRAEQRNQESRRQAQRFARRNRRLRDWLLA